MDKVRAEDVVEGGTQSTALDDTSLNIERLGESVVGSYLCLEVFEEVACCSPEFVLDSHLPESVPEYWTGDPVEGLGYVQEGRVDWFLGVLGVCIEYNFSEEGNAVGGVASGSEAEGVLGEVVVVLGFAAVVIGFDCLDYSCGDNGFVEFEYCREKGNWSVVHRVVKVPFFVFDNWEDGECFEEVEVVFGLKVIT